MSNLSKIEELKRRSYVLGKQAFLAGKPFGPCLDPHFMNSEILKGLEVGEGLVFIMQWRRGWEIENVRAEWE